MEQSRLVSLDRRTLLAVALLALTVVVVLTAIPSEESDAASSGSCGDDLTWTLDDDGKLSIAGTGAMYDYSSKTRPWGNAMKTVSIGDTITTISDYAFYKFTSLTSVTLGDELRTVSAYAFYACRSLGSFDAPDSLKIVGSYAFYRCSSLEDIGLGASLTTIGAGSFASCPAVSEMSIPQTLSIIGNDAFGALAFLDTDGDVLSKTAEALRGHVYTGSDGVLQITS